MKQSVKYFFSSALLVALLSSSYEDMQAQTRLQIERRNENSNQFQNQGNWRKSLLRIREERGRTISVTIDGKRFPKVSRSLTVGDLPAGKHSISIFRYNTNGYGYANGKLIYKGYIITKPGMIYYCNTFDGNMDIEENCCIDDYGQWNQNDNWENWDTENDCWNNNKNWSRNDSRQNQNPNYNEWNHKNDNDNWNDKNYKELNDNVIDNKFNNSNWNRFDNAMSEGRFTQLVEQVRKSSFETSKVNVANQGLKDNKITVKQLITILNEFSFESTKLQFAKDNYRNVVDKNNFFQVNDVFSFESSKDDLAKFLQIQN